MNILYMESYKILKLKCDSRLNFYQNISINFNEPTNTITETCQTHELPQNIKRESPGHLTSAGQVCVGDWQWTVSVGMRNAADCGNRTCNRNCKINI